VSRETEKFIRRTHQVAEEKDIAGRVSFGSEETRNAA
jgi:hypothetical protein